MAYTANDVYENALAIIDEITTSGTVDAVKTADYGGKAPKLIDMIQKELLASSDYVKTYEIARYPVTSMYGYQTGFNVEEYLGTEKTYEVANDSTGGVRAYYFETDSNTGTAYIEDYTSAWNILATISMTNSTEGFQAYRGSVTPTSGATKSRIRFTGSYYYKTVNRALFNTPFESGKEPIFTPWVKIALPVSCKTIKDVIIEYPERKYGKDSLYKIEWEDNRQYLFVDYYYQGKIRVQYKPVPTTVTSLSTALEVDDITSNLMAYKLAYHFMLSEQNTDVADRVMDEYKRLKGENSLKQPMGTSEIIDYYGIT